MTPDPTFTDEELAEIKRAAKVEDAAVAILLVLKPLSKTAGRKALALVSAALGEAGAKP